MKTLLLILFLQPDLMLACFFALLWCAGVLFLVHVFIKESQEAKRKTQEIISPYSIESQAYNLIQAIKSCTTYEHWCIYESKKLIERFCEIYDGEAEFIKHLQAIQKEERKQRKNIRLAEKVKPCNMDALRYAPE